MGDIIYQLYSDLSSIFLNNLLDSTLYNILDFLLNIFSYFSYVIIIIIIFSIIKDLILFVFGGGKICKIF